MASLDGRRVRLLALLGRSDVQRIELVQGKLQELMLVAPVSLCLGKIGPLFRLRWWISDLGNQEGSRSFGNAVDEHTEQGNLEEDEEPNAESKENTFAVVEPDLLLLSGESDT